jgi:hypothetical protein
MSSPPREPFREVEHGRICHADDSNIVSIGGGSGAVRGPNFGLMPRNSPMSLTRAGNATILFDVGYQPWRRVSAFDHAGETARSWAAAALPRA